MEWQNDWMTDKGKTILPNNFVAGAMKTKITKL